MDIARGQHLGERLEAVRVRAAGVNRRSERLPQKLGAALLKAVRGPRTLQESGLRGYVYDPWFGLLAPAATPKAVVDEINRAITVASKMPDHVERFTRLVEGRAVGLAAPGERLQTRAWRIVRRFRATQVQASRPATTGPAPAARQI